jgi:23S rRNA pseudouridine1911/1915/1917 synthase
MIITMKIEILLEHPWFLVINKPSGVLTQAVPGIDSVQTLLVKQLKDREPNGPVPFIGMPHRLDRVTSGVMVVARNQRALRRLSDQFALRTTKKLYRATIPIISERSGKWIDWIRKIPNEAKAEIVDREAEGAKEAILSFRVLDDSETTMNGIPHKTSTVEIELETGRMHQIRLQFAAHGYPILGDFLYGSDLRWLDSEPGQRESPIALHAYSIQFRNPQNAELIEVVAPTAPLGWSHQS